MGSKTYPVGSIVRVGKGKACIVGILFDELDGRFVKSYMIVPYPAGYTGSDSCCLVRAEKVKPVYPGYCSEMSEAWIHYVDNMEIAAGREDAEKVRSYLKQISAQQSGKEV